MYGGDKLAYDRIKCIREAKEILDHHLEAGLGKDSVSWGLQICGLEACLMSTHLFREGLVVAICQNTFQFPQNIKDLPEFIQTLKGLESLIGHNQTEALQLIGIYDKIHRYYSPSLNINADHRSRDNNVVSRPTYYTPPTKDQRKPVVPVQSLRKDKRRLLEKK